MAETKRRGGAVVSTERKRHWYKEWPERRLSHEGYATGSFELLGVYHYLKCLAGRSPPYDGRIRLSDGRIAHKRDLVRLLARKLGGMALSAPQLAEVDVRAGRLLEELVEACLLVVDASKVAYILDADHEWNGPSEQPEAVRKREQRGRRRGEQEPPDEGAAGAPFASTRPGGPAGPPAPLILNRSDADFDPDRGPPDYQGKSDVTAKCPGTTGTSRSRSRSREDAYASQDQEPRPAAAAAYASPPLTAAPLTASPLTGAGGPAGPPGRVDIYAMPPLRAACFVAGNDGQRFCGVARKYLNLIGQELFYAAVGEVHESVLGGVARHPGKLMVHVLKRHRRTQESARMAVEEMARPPTIGFHAGEGSP